MLQTGSPGLTMVDYTAKLCSCLQFPEMRKFQLPVFPSGFRSRCQLTSTPIFSVLGAALHLGVLTPPPPPLLRGLSKAPESNTEEKLL